MASSPITSWQIDGEKVEAVTDFIFWGSEITVDGDFSHEIKRPLLLGKKAIIKLGNALKSGNITDKDPYTQSYGFSSSHVCSHVWIGKVDHKEDYMLKNWCFWIMVLEKTLESPLAFKGDPTSQS